jgi:adenylate cyclase, class 2
MREIEIKVKIESVEAVLQRLNSAGVSVGEPVTQRDEVFGISGVDGGSNNNSPWLRIRTETKNNSIKYLFTLKKSITNQLDSIEHETEVSDPKELAEIIRYMEFIPYSDLTKTRRKATIGDIEICVDVVKGLGNFVEAEKLTDNEADYDAIINELWQLLESYGISRSDQVTDGYDVMMKKKEAEK